MAASISSSLIMRGRGRWNLEGKMYHGIQDIAYEADVRLTALTVLVVDENVEDSHHAKLFEAQSLELFKCGSSETAVHSVERQSIAGPGEPNFSRRKVLIVDEDIEDLTRNTKPFEAHGFEVHKCTSYESAMRSIEREDFELALVDQGSPLFEGRRVIRHLVRYNSRTPFIVLAFPNDLKCYQQASELGAVEYLEKPVSTAELNRVIQRYLGSPTYIL